MDQFKNRMEDKMRNIAKKKVFFLQIAYTIKQVDGYNGETLQTGLVIAFRSTIFSKITPSAYNTVYKSQNSIVRNEIWYKL